MPNGSCAIRASLHRERQFAAVRAADPAVLETLSGNGQHTVFGQVTQGLDVLQSLTPRDPQQNPDFEGDKILTIVIQEE